VNVHESVRHYWDEDAATHDLSPEHFPHARTQQAAWNAVLIRHLPPPHTFFGWLVVPLIAVVGARARWVPVLWKARHYGPMALAPSALYSSHE
jgi:hypothetical protein